MQYKIYLIMGYSIQNFETGELDYIHFDSSTQQRQRFDQETGEPSYENLNVRYVKHKRFQIPKKYLRGTVCEEFVKKMVSEDYQEDGIQAKVEECKPVKRKQYYAKEDYMNMGCVENDIILAYNKDNYRLFLIPTLFCFSVYLLLIMAFIELFLHFWGHRSNGLNMNKSYYYRSPLHVLTSPRTSANTVGRNRARSSKYSICCTSKYTTQKTRKLSRMSQTRSA